METEKTEGAKKKTIYVNMKTVNMIHQTAEKVGVQTRFDHIKRVDLTTVYANDQLFMDG